MIIQSRKMYYEESFKPLQLVIEKGKITNILPYDSLKADVDYGENKILPGLIDIHNHGYLGCDANHATVDWVKKWMNYLAKEEGVTSTLPAVSSCEKAQILDGMRNISQAVKEGYKGANILGIYSEGPFISEKYRGAQSWDTHLIPTKEIIDEMLEASNGLLNYVMLAPEMLDDISVISYCCSKGIKVSIGHSGADFETCKKAIEAGVTSFTHTFNGMSGIHHRNPGVATAAMYFEDTYAELIGDGIHVCYPVAKILAKAKGKDKLITVTDSVSFKGFEVGKEIVVSDQVRIVCEDGVGRLEDGTICGSANKLNELLKREIEVGNIDEVTVINSVTCNPANLLGFGNCKGYIKENYDADLVVLDEEYKPVQTYVAGDTML